jgi:hypothetical protein
MAQVPWAIQNGRVAAVALAAVRELGVLGVLGLKGLGLAAVLLGVQGQQSAAIALESLALASQLAMAPVAVE